MAIYVPSVCVPLRLHLVCVYMCVYVPGVWRMYMYPQNRAEGAKNPLAGIPRTRPYLLTLMMTNIVKGLIPQLPWPWLTCC